MENYSMNPLKQNIKLKQYIGWFAALCVPFATRYTADRSGIPLIPALIYWMVCGILLRLSFEKKLPYFQPQINKIKKEFVILIFAALLGSLLLLNNHIISELLTKRFILTSLLFALLNGIFEPLVWSNIFSLAGCRIKLTGFAASFICASLMLVFFWQVFIPILTFSSLLFVFVQVILFIIPLIIYSKTKDLTLWSVQHIIYNFIIIFLTNN